MLREAGLEVGPGRVSDALHGLDAVNLGRQDDVYWTLRQTLGSVLKYHEDLETVRDTALATLVEEARAVG